MATTNEIQNVNGNATNNAAANNATPATAKTYDEIVAALKADSNNKVITSTIASARFNELKGKTGKPYWNMFITLVSSIPAYVQNAEGDYVLSTMRSMQMPWWQLELVMRGHRFFGRFANYISEMIPIDNGGEQFVVDLDVTILAEFVAAGEDKQNPFTRKENKYGIKDYDRYIYHIIDIAEPSTPIAIDTYRDAIADMRAAAREAMKAARAAKANRAALLASAEATTEEVPF